MVIIIPTRHDSKRLPGKPLLDVCGIPLIRRVFNQCVDAGVGEVYVAADKSEILDLIPNECRILVQSDFCRCGTDRVGLAALMQGRKDEEIILNIQGDMPYISTDLIKDFASFMRDKDCGTAAIPVSGQESIYGNVSVVTDREKRAIYFSRQAIPMSTLIYYRHIGIYGYTVATLKKFLSHHASKLEKTEDLEQLRIVENKLADIHVMLTEHDPGPELNTREDYKFISDHWNERNVSSSKD